MRHEGNFGEMPSRDVFSSIVEGNSWGEETQSLDRTYAAVARVDETLALLDLNQQLQQHESAALMPREIKNGYEYFIEAQDIRRGMVDCELNSGTSAGVWSANRYLKIAIDASKRISVHPQKEQWIAAIDSFAPSMGPELPSPSFDELVAAKTREAPSVFPRRIFFNALVGASEAHDDEMGIQMPMRMVASAAYRAALAIDTLPPVDRPQLVSDFCRETNIPPQKEMALYDTLIWYFQDQESIRPIIPAA